MNRKSLKGSRQISGIVFGGGLALTWATFNHVLTKAAHVGVVRTSQRTSQRLTASWMAGTMVLAVMRHLLRPLVVLGLIVAISGAAWAECLSGGLTPEQKACCTAMHHDCGAAGVEMGCCSTEPQTQDRVQAASLKPDLGTPALVTGPVALLPEPHVRIHAVAAAAFDRGALKLPERPTYLLLSVFLI